MSCVWHKTQHPQLLMGILQLYWKLTGIGYCFHLRLRRRKPRFSKAKEAFHTARKAQGRPALVPEYSPQHRFTFLSNTIP